MHKSGGLNWILFIVVAVVLSYLVTAHGAHLLAYLPFSFLLGCLFMHMFMHGGHGHHHSHENHSKD